MLWQYILAFLNTFVIFLSRIVATIIDNVLRGGDDEGGGLGFMWYLAVTIVLDLVFGLFASMIVMWFSKRHEFVADKGAAYLTSNTKMFGALRRLQAHQEPSHLPDQVAAAFGVRPKEGGLANYFRSHPPLEEQIAALQQLQ